MFDESLSPGNRKCLVFLTQMKPCWGRDSTHCGWADFLHQGGCPRVSTATFLGEAHLLSKSIFMVIYFKNPNSQKVRLNKMFPVMTIKKRTENRKVSWGTLTKGSSTESWELQSLFVWFFFCYGGYSCICSQWDIWEMDLIMGMGTTGITACSKRADHEFNSHWCHFRFRGEQGKQNQADKGLSTKGQRCHRVYTLVPVEVQGTSFPPIP